LRPRSTRSNRRPSLTSSPDFGSRAARYDELRPVDEQWWEVFRLVEREADLAGRRVLDIGCGTGRLEAALAGRARAWGVDAEPAMLEVASRNAPDATFKQGRAEQLPFKDGWFERAVMWLSAHLVDRPQAFAEARRVLGPDGRLAVVTFDPSYFDGFWLNTLFPSMERADRARFSTADELEDELRAAGFAQVELTNLSQSDTRTRSEALERIRGKHISTFDLISEEEYEEGLARAERELPERFEYRVEWLIAVADG
jgi:ubiquinone/menaquinone biosynthesis C-methylase UbiE